MSEPVQIQEGEFNDYYEGTDLVEILKLAAKDLEGKTIYDAGLKKNENWRSKNTGLPIYSLRVKIRSHG